MGNTGGNVTLFDVMCVTGQVTSHIIVINGIREVGQNVQSHE